MHRNGNLVRPWILTVQTTAINQTFGLTLQGTPLAVKVIWGDGSFNDYTTPGAKNHTFAAAGTYQVLVSGSGSPGGASVTTGGNRLISTSPLQGVVGFYPNSTFANCNNAAFTSLPNELYKNCAESAMFSYGAICFGCNKLVSLPADLFSYHIGSGYTSFDFAFTNDTALTAIPPTLFDRARISSGPGVRSFNTSFSGCTALTGPAPELWDPAQFNVPSSHANCFKNCTGLSNWADIPNDWKGL